MNRYFSRTARVALGLLALAAVFGAVGSAHANATFIVNSTADAVDAAPGDGVCASASGDCTLRAAIQETDALPGPDNITLPAGTYKMGIPPAGADALATGDVTGTPATGDFDITDDLTIDGQGSAVTVIDGAHLDRVFLVNGSPTVEISGVTVQNGYEAGGAGAGGIGSALGNLTLNDVVVRDNATAAFGGGVGIISGKLTVIDSAITGNAAGQAGGGMVFANGDVTIIRSVISGNSTGPQLGGGGIANGAHNLTMVDSVVSGNTAGVTAGGGGIGNANNAQQTVTITNSVVTGNTTTGQGGGINNNNPTITLVLDHSTVANNTAGTSGGGIGNNGSTVAIMDSTVSGNTAGEGGGGISSGGGTVTLAKSVVARNSANPSSGIGGGILQSAGSVTVTDSIVRDNSSWLGGGIGNPSPGALMVVGTQVINNSASGVAPLPQAGLGLGAGGIGNSGTLTVIDSTISGNSVAHSNSGGIGSFGPMTITGSTISGNFAATAAGGIGNGGGALTLTNSTVSGNRTGGGGGGIASIGTADLNNVTITGNVADGSAGGLSDGGGLLIAGTATVANSIIGGNATSAGQGPDCSGAPMASHGHNLIGSTAGCVFASGPGDIVGQDAKLGPLSDNGGPTPTHALLAGSPAIDAGSPAVPSGSPACAATDQRGVARPQDGDANGIAVCDIGAFEKVMPAGCPTSFTLTVASGHPKDHNGDGYICRKIVPKVDGKHVVEIDNNQGSSTSGSSGSQSCPAGFQLGPALLSEADRNGDELDCERITVGLDGVTITHWDNDGL